MIHAGFASVFLLPLLQLAAGQLVTNPKALLVCGSSLGCLRGIHMPGYQIKRFEAFLGIPYAQPPVGELRFSNPKIMPKLRGIYNANAAKPDCIQKNYLLPTPIIYGQEDCLYLNVYRPERRSGQPLPVLVYIHGGGFFSGSAGPLLTGPEYFMDTGEVLLVTMAYRLGALGFLSTQDAAMPGNFGLKDQQLALRWVQRNIKSFGGDPRRVTLFGQSAGGVATHMHMLSARSAGLFQQVISMSGTANVPFAIEPEPLQQARRTAALCQVANAWNLSTPKLARALRIVDVETLLNAGDGLKFWNVDHMANYRPVVEQSFATAAEEVEQEAFLSVHPQTLLAEGSYRPVPWLLGTVPEEGAVRVVNIMENATLRQDFNGRFDELLQQLLELPREFSAEQRAHTMQLVSEKYFHNRNELSEQTVQGFLDLVSDRGFKQPLYTAVRQHLASVHVSREPLYLYSFNYLGPHSYASVYTSANVGNKYGVVHCDDLIYLFRSPMLFPDFERNSTEARLIQSFVGYFVHFAKFGKPRNVESLRSCSEAVLLSRPEGICDHHVFQNAPNDRPQFEVNVSQRFRATSAKFWSNLLAEPKHY
ncbi:juvenile hormone esterase [Drosophila virilis]|nr:venom carboxylesterase-6 [Drosophila virilis]